MSRPPDASARATASLPAAEGGSPIEHLLLRCEPRVRAMLDRYEVAPEDTEDLLFQALIVLVYRWEELGDPESWLFTTLRFHCQRYRRQCKRRPAD